MRFGDSLLDVVAAYLGPDDSRMIEAKATRWLRAEYDSIQSAKKDLRVSAVITDADFLDYLQLLAGFCRACGYKGLLVLVDEMGVLVQNLHGAARQANFDVLLNALNRSCQGAGPGLGIVLAGTCDFLEHSHRGLLSYESLRTRLASSALETKNGEMQNGPVLRITPLKKGLFR
jgi:hypothetical protein